MATALRKGLSPGRLLAPDLNSELVVTVAMTPGRRYITEIGKYTGH